MLNAKVIVMRATQSIRPEGHRSRRVLVVDDNQDLVRTTSFLLKSQGFEVATAHDGCAAIEKARSFRPDFVLLDIGLPILDGYQVAERLRGDASTKEAMIIAISA